MGPPDIPEEIAGVATSVLIEGGRRFARWKLLVDFWPLRGADGTALLPRSAVKLLSLYRRGCDTIGREIRVVQDEEIFNGRATGITPEGALGRAYK